MKCIVLGTPRAESQTLDRTADIHRLELLVRIHKVHMCCTVIDRGCGRGDRFHRIRRQAEHRPHGVAAHEDDARVPERLLVGSPIAAHEAIYALRAGREQLTKKMAAEEARGAG
jgi:hypothetical protein